MEQTPTQLGHTHSCVRALALHVALSKAHKFSGPQAQEVWRVMQVIASNGPFDGVPGAMIQLAIRCNQFPEVWKDVVTKALIYKRLAGKRTR